MNTFTTKDKIYSFLLINLRSDGASRVVLNLAKGFIERGLRVDIVVLKAEGDALGWIPSGARVVELNVKDDGLHKLLYLAAIARYLKKEQPTALIIGKDNNINLGSIAKYLARVRTQVILICHTHLSQFFQHSPASVTNSPTGYLLRKFLGFYDWADQIVTVSQGVADDLVEIAGRPLKRLRVIYNPVITPDLFAKAQEPIDHPWFASGEPPVILGVGRLQAMKDFPTLIRAVALVRQYLPARLMILGEGEERSRLEALINELGLTDAVALLGFVNNPYAFMFQASLVASSSLVEGFGNVIAESLACGTPVVSTDCPSGPAEILEFGKYGSLVPMANVEALAQAIVTTLISPVDTGALKQRAKKFSLETAVDSYLELLHPDYIGKDTKNKTLVRV